MKNLLQEHSAVVQVIAEAGNGGEAIQKIEELRPDLIFLDIQMPDLTGFEVLEKLSRKPTIIFTTAYEQYAIKAFESFSIDYLLKPIKEERLNQSIEKLKVLGRLNSSIDIASLQEVIKQFQAPPKRTWLKPTTKSWTTRRRTKLLQEIELFAGAMGRLRRQFARRPVAPGHFATLRPKPPTGHHS